VVKRTWVLSKKKNHWRECEVVEENDHALKVHYISYHPKFDEWIEKTSDRLRARRLAQDLKKGDNLSAWYPKVRAWTEAEIEEIDLAKNTIRVAFIGTREAAVFHLNSGKLSVVHKRSNEPCEMIRQMKKLNTWQQQCCTRMLIKLQRRQKQNLDKKFLSSTPSLRESVEDKFFLVGSGFL